MRAMTPTISQPNVPAAGVAQTIRAAGKTGVLAAFETLMAWQARSAERRRMLEMSADALRDAGLTRGDALRAARKPFWRA